MSSTHQEIHLWPELLPCGKEPARGGRSGMLEPFVLPFAPAKLAGKAERPRLLGVRDAGAGDCAVLEPFFNSRKQLKLLAAFPHGVDAQINGGPAPRWAVLDMGDVIQWSAGIAFHVTIFNRPQIGPAPADLVGKPCPICRVPFTPTTTTWTCACRCVVHCEADEKNGLQCAQLRGECPRCKRPVVLQPGYAFTPGDE